MRKRTKYKVADGTSYHADTPWAVIDVLERVRRANIRVHLTYGYTKAGQDVNKGPIGRSWLEECDVDGTIGRSMGPVKIPILIHNSRSMGGASILDHCIVRITTTTKPRKVLYQHPTYSAPTLEKAAPDMEGYKTIVLADGKVHARFRTEAAADRWLARMA